MTSYLYATHKTTGKKETWSGFANDEPVRILQQWLMMEPKSGSYTAATVVVRFSDSVCEALSDQRERSSEAADWQPPSED